MLPRLSRFGRIGLLAGLLVGLTAGAAPIAALRLIGVQTLPNRMPFQHTIVGGLSGLDYDAATDTWISESDDKSEFSPARFYTLRLHYDEAGFAAAEVIGVSFFRQPDGSLYPDKAGAAAHGGAIPDLESIRFDPADGSVWYTSEGDRPLGMNPFVRQATQDGRFLAELPPPAMFEVHPDREAGPRHNLSFEGLSFAPDGQSLWLAMEAPLYEDGPVPTATSGAVSRLTHCDRSGKLLGQYAYPIDPIPIASAAGRLADNGVSELLAVDDRHFLALERAGVQDVAEDFRFHIRLYEADLGGATDVSRLATLAGATYQPMAKRLLLDFDRLGQPWVDNLEGIAWGRRLANGHATLVLVSDDNFTARQQTQFWAFEVIPAAVMPKPSRQWDDVFDGVVQDEHRIAGFVGPYRWLSNYFECPVTYEGRAYGSSEAAYHASKFPETERDEFTKLDPDAAKKLSRRKKLDQAWWDVRKETVMREITRAKFAQNHELADRLLATGDRSLEELNWWGDKFWGTVQGEGQNVLGKILMEVRAELRAAPRK